MTHSIDTFFCEACGCPEYSSVGNPLYSFQKSALNVLLVCADCLKELEEEKEERERVENELNEAA